MRGSLYRAGSKSFPTEVVRQLHIADAPGWNAERDSGCKGAVPTQDSRREFDPAALRRAQRGRPAALRAVVDHHAPAVYSVLSRILGPAGHASYVDDLAQETMVRVVGALPRFVPDGPAKLSTWVLTIATRLALQHLQRRRPTVVDAELSTLRSPAGNPEAEFTAAELRARVQAVVAEMSPEVRAAFVLADAHGMSPAEVAEALEIPAATARTRIHRARGRIRAALDQGDDA